MKKHIVIAKLFDSGGSNAYFKTLLNYLGPANVIVILEDTEQLQYFNELIDHKPQVRLLNRLHRYAHLKFKFTTSVKHFFFILRSVITIFWLSAINGFADLTISAVESEKYLYLFWVPFIKVHYVLHSEPPFAYNSTTVSICNRKLGRRKNIITVSDDMKKLIINRWQIKERKSRFVYRIYNCLPQNFNP